MLIIAIPKSASTSLLATLKKIHKCKGKQIIFPNNKKPKGYNIIHKYHSDFRELTKDEIKLFQKQTFFYKQHIPPTVNNIKLLEKVKKKVLLLRNPAEIVEAYYRADQKLLHKPRSEFQNISSLREWKLRSKQVGLFKDLTRFYQIWSKHGNILKIDYSQLIDNPTKTINQISTSWDLPVVKRIIMDKKRYSRNNSLVNNVKTKLKKLAYKLKN
jgi:hypothetical protein